jgi:hypothetical protein
VGIAAGFAHQKPHFIRQIGKIISLLRQILIPEIMRASLRFSSVKLLISVAYIFTNAP